MVRRDNEEDANDSLWTQFTQQKLKAWHTVLPPTFVIALYVLGGVLFIAVGVYLLSVSWGVQEYSVSYGAGVVDKDDDGVSTLSLTVTKDMEPPIWVYYQLDSFHQNHRRYVKSRDDNQIKAAKPVQITKGGLADCAPAVMSDDGRALYPCGLVASSVFNDTFAIVSKGPKEDAWHKVKVDSSARTIAWAADIDSGNFKNYDPEEKHSNGKLNQENLDMWLLQRFPPVACEQAELSDTKKYKPVYVGTKKAGDHTAADCRGYTKNPECNFVDSKGKKIECTGEYKKVVVDDWGIESGHFLVWMRVAGLPTFRKLWGKVDEKLLAGTKLHIYVADNFPVKEFNGKKAIVISTSSPLGGRNDFLGSGYVVVGICCLVFGTWFVYKNKRQTE